MKIIDLHNDALTKLDGKKFTIYIKQCKKQGVIFLSNSFFSSKFDKEKCFDILEEKYKILRNVKNNNYVLHLEDIFFADDPEKVAKLTEYKPFSYSLTWNSNNVFAGGANDNRHLTNFGKYTIKYLSNHKILLDYAHLNKDSFWESTEISKAPIYVSHTGFYFDNNCPRNLDDNQIKKIIETHGFIGVYMFKQNIIGNKEKYNAYTYAKTIYDFVQLYGDKNIGLGTDFYGLDEYPENINNYSDLKNLKKELKQLGLSNSAIKRVFYKNFFEFLQRKN